MFRYNHLNNTIPFNERRKIVIRMVAKHQNKVDALLRKQYPVYDDEEEEE